MPRLTGTIVAGGAPAEGAYVQIQNFAGDFQAEVRTDAAGREASSSGPDIDQMTIPSLVGSRDGTACSYSSQARARRRTPSSSTSGSFTYGSLT